MDDADLGTLTREVHPRNLTHLGPDPATSAHPRASAPGRLRVDRQHRPHRYRARAADSSAG